MRRITASVTVAAFTTVVLLAGCASAPTVQAPPLNGRSLWDAYLEVERYFSWTDASGEGGLTIRGSIVDGALRLRLQGAGESDVEREPYESGSRVVFGFSGRVSGPAHLLLALHMPEVLQLGDSWTADRIYGDNVATYRVDGVEDATLPDGSVVHAYRIEVQIDSDRDDLRGSGEYLVAPEFGVVRLTYRSANGETRIVATEQRPIAQETERSDRIEGAPSGFFQIVPGPGQTDVFVDADVHLALRRRIDPSRVVDNFRISPDVDHAIYVRPFTSESDSIVTVELADLEPDTTYRVEFSAALFAMKGDEGEAFASVFRTGSRREFEPAELTGRPVITEPPAMGTPLSFRLEWETIASAVEYEVQETAGVGFSDSTRRWVTSDAALEITVPRPNEWYYRVRGISSTGQVSDWSRIHFVGAGK